ncbi:MAG: phosphatidate cytidylyltransferase [Oscillospiraceae bacterium]|nr:phosphatidate cytidylyltransferase [Oscillospiraceae bacterium]
MTNFLEKASKKFKGERTLSTIIIVTFMLLFWALSYKPFKLPITLMTALISSLATYELLKSVKCRNKVLYAVTMIYSVAEVFLLSYKVSVMWTVLLTAYIIGIMILMVIMHESTNYVDIICGVFGSVVYTYSLSCFILIRDFYLLPGGANYTKQDCFWLYLLIFGASWLNDAGAFLVGRKFGKHKLCPKISPKKSVEGAVGGVVITVIAVNIVYTVYDLIINAVYGFHTLGGGVRRYLVMSAVTVVLSILSMFGDLSASVHKRKCGIKDYSNILPGHGGILDRFDSSIFVLPAMYALLCTFGTSKLFF